MAFGVWFAYLCIFFFSVAPRPPARPLASARYIHVLDNNTHCRRVVVGPATFTKQEHEKVLFSKPQSMIVLPPQHYVVIDSPAQREGGVSATPATYYGVPPHVVPYWFFSCTYCVLGGTV